MDRCVAIRNVLQVASFEYSERSDVIPRAREGLMVIVNTPEMKFVYSIVL